MQTYNNSKIILEFLKCIKYIVILVIFLRVYPRFCQGYLDKNVDIPKKTGPIYQFTKTSINS